MSRRFVQVRAGIPGLSSVPLDDGRFPYPVTTDDFAKLLRLSGFEVEFEHQAKDRAVVSHNAADVWLPVLAFSLQVLQEVSVDVLSSIILRYLGSDGVKSSTLHVRFEVVKPDGTEQRFESHGPGDKVVEAIDAFRRSLQG